jgi:hypothetical protein
MLVSTDCTTNEPNDGPWRYSRAWCRPAGCSSSGRPSGTPSAKPAARSPGRPAG